MIILASLSILLETFAHGTEVVELPALPAQKCYSCASPLINLRWPKSENNRFQYLREFPWFSNASCDEFQARNSLPVVDCPGSVCIKAIIKEAPAKREICVEGGAIVRDCWSRVMHLNPYGLEPPRTKRDLVRLTEDPSGETTIGYIYTCKGYLCNKSYTSSKFTFVIVCMLWISFVIF